MLVFGVCDARHNFYIFSLYRNPDSNNLIYYCSLSLVREAVNEMKSGKAPGLDGFPVECLKKGGMSVLEWLVRLLNLILDMGVVPMDWRGACIVPVQREG